VSELEEIIQSDPSVTPPAPRSPHAHRPVSIMGLGSLAGALICVAGVLLGDVTWVTGLGLAVIGASLVTGNILVLNDYEDSVNWMVFELHRVRKLYEVGGSSRTRDIYPGRRGLIKFQAAGGLFMGAVCLVGGIVIPLSGG
jgi:hypothetical protein